MRVLATTAQVNTEIRRLIHECSSCRVAVAWASIGFPAFDLLTKRSSKIEKMVVGTHFYQTHPGFIEHFMTHPNVRFVMNTDGVFHPKVYYFDKSEGEWECIIGSPNFTKGGLDQNVEMAILVTNHDHGSQQVLADIQSSIDDYWHEASQFTQSQWVNYREAWQRKQPLLNSLKGKFGDPKKEDADDKGKAPFNVPILRMAWADYFEKVKSEKGHHNVNVEGRLKVIRGTRQLFADQTHFNQLDKSGRLRIAGLIEEADVDYLLFGSMQGAGKFWKTINENDEIISLALDLIPAVGAISRDMYLGYIEQYKKAFPQGRHGVGTATRLLAMKRPDTFVCLDDRNKSGLCGAFNISRNVDYESYWDSIVARILEATWWNSPPPRSGIEREIWTARAAFLDSIYFEAKDLN